MQNDKIKLTQEAFDEMYEIDLTPEDSKQTDTKTLPPTETPEKISDTVLDEQEQIYDDILFENTPMEDYQP